MNLKYLYIFLAIIFFAPCTYAQESTTFDRETWADITKDIDYNGADSENTRTKEGRGNEGLEREKAIEFEESTPSSGSFSLPSFGGQIFQFIMIIVFVALLAFLIYKILGGQLGMSNPKNKKDRGEAVTIEDLEEKLMESDLMRWLKKAVSEKNYKLALRIYYLMIIKELAQRGLIKWKKEKTNLEYLMEMRDHSTHGQFEELTGIYQLVWYGDKEVGDKYLIEMSHKFKAYFQYLNNREAHD
ncbi:DUF4129 domain-containing protein [Fulvivirga sediminis]|uniref:DUF4129 domain-containing protein n=1 Tax=Fulvivirga sediminis TaxID=2803949 RepID=A0A937FAY3_9BACT|nr:DUF4129 domain-containing protein [Fulvivirga sediminis]MBL3657138.1 DUF4129 domain-containing protein [Fulvivirga sediminis]